MPRGLPHSVRDAIEKCRSATIAAVDVYNRPGPRFRTSHYIVLIVIAWTSLFHAIFYNRGRRPWFQRRKSGSGRGTRYLKINGEPKHWDLEECLRQFYGGRQPPERKNLEFILGLRNKIEHRNLPQIDAAIFGECQAALLNLERLLVDSFGPSYALADQLAVSLQFSKLIPDVKAKATRAAATAATRTVTQYIETFRTGLPAGILDSMQYSFSVFLVPRVANRQSAADVSVQFVSVDEANPEERKRLERLNVLIREKTIPISNLGMLKPGEVVQGLVTRIPWKFTINAHTLAWKYYKVRPSKGVAHPERTTAEYCVFDEVHQDYVYTSAWLDKLAREFNTARVFEEVIGRPPVRRVGG